MKPVLVVTLLFAAPFLSQAHSQVALADELPTTCVDMSGSWTCSRPGRTMTLQIQHQDEQIAITIDLAGTFTDIYPFSGDWIERPDRPIGEKLLRVWCPESTRLRIDTILEGTGADPEDPGYPDYPIYSTQIDFLSGSAVLEYKAGAGQQDDPYEFIAIEEYRCEPSNG